MKINGIKKLKKNDYDDIKIRNNKITVSGGGNEPSIQETSEFDDVKIMPNNDVIDLVCSYFTRYHNINNISERLPIGEVSTIDGKTLSYERPLPRLSADIMLKNYLFSRSNFVLNEDMSNIKVGLYQKESSYKSLDDKKLFILNIDKDGKLIDMEYKFLISLIETIFKNENVSILYEKEILWDVIELYSEEHILKLSTLFLHDERVIYLFENFVREHNKQLDKTKVLQMKMEEF